MKFLKVLIIFNILFPLSTIAQIRDFETTRLQSTSGAGVATILVNETAILNPAPIVFVPVSSFYYQKGNSRLEESDLSDGSFSDGSSQMYLLSDSTTRLKGTFSYQDHSERSNRRKRFTSSVANNFGKKTALGVLYRYTIDDIDNEIEKYHQAVIGLTHIYSEELTFGATVTDPFLSNKEDTSIIVGFQYALSNNFFIILDGGSKYNDDPENNTLSRGALQVNFFKDFYLRTGRYYNKITNLKGQSWGFSWIGPRLSLEYAYKTSENVRNVSGYLQKGEQIIENSFSFAIVF